MRIGIFSKLVSKIGDLFGGNKPNKVNVDMGSPFSDAALNPPPDIAHIFDEATDGLGWLRGTFQYHYMIVVDSPYAAYTEFGAGSKSELPGNDGPRDIYPRFAKALWWDDGWLEAPIAKVGPPITRQNPGSRAQPFLRPAIEMNGKQFIAKMSVLGGLGAAGKMTEQTARDIVADAKSLAPVDTGDLKDSIFYTQSMEGVYNIMQSDW